MAPLLDPEEIEAIQIQSPASNQQPPISQVSSHDLLMQSTEQANDCGDEEDDDEDESMSLKDVIMTLNEFYAVKLENMMKLLKVVDGVEQATEEQVTSIEATIKDNEVRIPYDEDIFIGIDKNYKTLKKTLECIKCIRDKSKKRNFEIEETEAQMRLLKEGFEE